jgi:hypothetical protein
VRAAGDGEVAAITQDTDRVPILVIRHSDGLLTVYANIRNISVTRGQSISRGQQVAEVGPGDPSFLHFEVRRGFEAVDPDHLPCHEGDAVQGGIEPPWTAPPPAVVRISGKMKARARGLSPRLAAMHLEAAGGRALGAARRFRCSATSGPQSAENSRSNTAACQWQSGVSECSPRTTGLSAISKTTGQVETRREDARSAEGPGVFLDRAREDRGPKARGHQFQEKPLRRFRDAVGEDVVARAPARLPREHRRHLGHLGPERLVQAGGGGFVHQARRRIGQFEDARPREKVTRRLRPGGILQHRHQLKDRVQLLAHLRLGDLAGVGRS